MKRTIALILALLLAALCGCGESADIPEEPVVTEAPAATPEPEVIEPEDLRPEEVRVLTDEPENLDPVTMPAEHKSCLLEIYEPLFTTETRGGELIAVLADSSQGENGLSHEEGTGVYTVFLRSGLTDHDGNALTAADAAFCYTRAAENAGWTGFVSAEAAGETELTLTFKKELTGAGELHGVLSDICLYTEKAFTDSEGFAAAACGTGPYRLESYSAGDRLTVREWDGYRIPAEERSGRAGTNVSAISYLFGTENAASESARRVIDLEIGKADMADCLDYADTVDFRGEGSYADRYRVENGWSDINYILLANQHSYSMGKHESIRTGLFYSIDLEMLADTFGEGGARACGAVCNPDYPDCLSSWAETESYQTKVLPVDEARAILRKVSYVNEPLQVLAVAGTQGEELAAAIQTMLMPRSITLCVVSQPEEDFKAAVASRSGWDFAVMPVKADDCAAEVWKTLWTDGMEGNGTVTGFIRVPEFNTLLKAVSTEEGCTEENIDALMRYIIDNQIAMGLVQTAVPVVVPEWMSEVFLTARGELLPGACRY